MMIYQEFANYMLADRMSSPHYTAALEELGAGSNSCLLVVDVQNGFIGQRTRHVVPRIESLLKESLFEHVIFTKFINSQDSACVSLLGWNSMFAGEETEISSLLQSFAKEIYSKSTYTALTQELHQYLRQRQIATVFICGIDIDCCVLTTAIDLFKIGIRPYVLTHYSASNGGYNSKRAAITVLDRLIGAHHIIDRELKGIRHDHKTCT